MNTPGCMVYWKAPVLALVMLKVPLAGLDVTDHVSGSPSGSGPREAPGADGILIECDGQVAGHRSAVLHMQWVNIPVEVKKPSVTEKCTA